MKKLLAFLLLVSLASSAVAENATMGNVNLMFGSKSLNSNEWPVPFDSQGEFGILIDVQPIGWPVSLAVDLLGSAEEVAGLVESTSELDFGVRMVFDLGGTTLHPYVGGGLGLIGARVEDTWFGNVEEDSTLGTWISGGIFVTLGEHFNLGLELRHSSGVVNLPTLGQRDAGGDHVGLLLGYHW